MVQSSDKHEKKSCSERIKKLPSFLWEHIRSWQFVYLILFTAANSMSIYFSNTTDSKAGYIVPFVLMTISLLIKIVLCWKKVSLKQLWEMQFAFLIPYILTTINILLLVFAGYSLTSNPQFGSDSPNYMEFVGFYSAQYMLVTMVCSLVMNKKTTTKMEYYFLILNIILQAAANLYLTIFYIQNVNEGIDQMEKSIMEITTDLIGRKIELSDFNDYYDEIHQFQGSFEVAKDFILASLASIIAVLLIMMDLIGRPFEKVQLHQQIYEGFVKHYDLPVKVKRTHSNQIKVELLPQQELSSSPRHTYKQNQINMSEQSSRR